MKKQLFTLTFVLVLGISISHLTLRSLSVPAGIRKISSEDKAAAPTVNAPDNISTFVIRMKEQELLNAWAGMKTSATEKPKFNPSLDYSNDETQLEIARKVGEVQNEGESLQQTEVKLEELIEGKKNRESDGAAIEAGKQLTDVKENLWVIEKLDRLEDLLEVSAEMKTSIHQQLALVIVNTEEQLSNLKAEKDPSKEEVSKFEKLKEFYREIANELSIQFAAFNPSVNLETIIANTKPTWKNPEGPLDKAADEGDSKSTPPAPEEKPQGEQTPPPSDESAKSK